MFGTFRYCKTTKDYQHVEISNENNVDARGYTLVACDSCRARKLKCNGNRNNCDRCLANPSRSCTYIGKKRSRQHSISQSTDGSPPRVQRVNEQDLPIHSQVETPASSSANSTCISPSTTSELSSSLPSSTSTTVAESLHHSGFSEFPWGILNDNYQSEVGETQKTPFPSTQIDWSLLGDFQSPLASSEWRQVELQNFSVPGIQTMQNKQGQDCESDISSFSPDKGKHAVAHMKVDSSMALTQPVGKGQLCKCLDSLTRLLEDIDISAETTEIDILLMCVGQGTKVCSDVLACNCNVCVQNAMLFATIAQQLVSAVKNVSNRLLVLNHKDQSDGSDSCTGCGGELSFGKYRIESPKMKLRIVQKILLLHLEDLQTLLAAARERVGSKRGASVLLAEAEGKVSNVSWMIQELSE